MAPTLPFSSALEFETWLGENFARPEGLWVKVAKKASGIDSVTYDEALDIALCFGWIDGQRKSVDEMYFVQRFTPRRARSRWSKRNVAKVADLTAAGRMRPSGLAEVEAAKADGRWENASDLPRDTVLPDDFLAALAKNEGAQAFFNTLGKSKIYLIAMSLQTAKKPETRQRRFDAALRMLEKGEFK